MSAAIAATAIFGWNRTARNSTTATRKTTRPMSACLVTSWPQAALTACLAKGQSLNYAGRARSPSPAAGHFADHVIEQTTLVADALVNPLRGESCAE